MCNNYENSQPNNYIDVFNVSTPSFQVRYIGTCYLSDRQIPYMSSPFNSLMHVRTNFPAGAIYIVNTIQVYTIQGIWSDLLTSIHYFPGSYCYLVSGSLSNPQVIEIPCPNQNNLTSNKYCNNILQTNC